MPLRRVEWQLDSVVNRVPFAFMISGNPAEEGVGTIWNQITTSWDTWTAAWGDGTNGFVWNNLAQINWDVWQLPWSA